MGFEWRFFNRGLYWFIHVISYTEIEPYGGDA